MLPLPFIITQFRRDDNIFLKSFVSLPCLRILPVCGANAERSEVLESKNLNPKQVDQLLQAASKKLGVPPEQLKSELESGKYDKVLKNMSQKDSAMLQKVMQNPKMVEKLISSPQAKALYQKLSGK